MDATVSLIENKELIETIPSSCCGMAGSFGYQSGNYDVSMDMAELSLLLVVRQQMQAKQLVYVERAADTKFSTDQD